MTIGELFGTLQQSVTEEWREHLKTNKYSKHMALNEYYEEMPEKVDKLIEAWQADHDNIEEYSCLINAEEHDALSYLKALKDIVIEGRAEFFNEKTELESLCDDVLALIDATMYKLDKLTEGLKGLVEFIKENINEANINMVNARLQQRLDKEGFGDIKIYAKYNGFYLDSDDPKWHNVLQNNKHNFIKLRDFKDLTEDEWIQFIKDVLSTIS